MSDGTTRLETYTTNLKYSWNYPEEITISVGQTGSERVLSNKEYREVEGGKLQGSPVHIKIANPVTTPSFENRLITFYTSYEDRITDHEFLYLSYDNSNIIEHGAIIEMDPGRTQVDSQGDTVGIYYPIGSTVEFYMTSEELVQRHNIFPAYINQVIRKNNRYEDEKKYNIHLNPRSETANLDDIRFNGDDLWHIYDEMNEPGLKEYKREYLLYTEDNEFFMKIIFRVGPIIPVLTINPNSLTFTAKDESSQEVVAYSNFDVDIYGGYPEWIYMKKTSDKHYQVSVANYVDSDEDRHGEVTFYNTAGQTAVLRVNQIPTSKYLYAIVPESNSEVIVNPSDTYFTISATDASEIYSFYVVSNIQYSVWLNGTFKQGYNSTGGTRNRIEIELPENQTTETMTHTIEVRSELDPCSIEISKVGRADKMAISTIYDGEFHKFNAMDLLRTEKIITVTCNNPSLVSLSVDDDDLVVKKYYQDENSKKLTIHCYPRTVKVWSQNKTVRLTISYRGQEKTIDFSIESTMLTVGRYFNVCSTIESFTINNESSQTLTLTAWSANGTLSLEAADLRSTILGISNPVIKGTGSYHWYEWTVTIPKGKFPHPGTPWTLKVTRYLQGDDWGESSEKYISIYESSDVAWDNRYNKSLQFTAYGHTSIMDGTQIMPIVYEGRYMTSNIGTSVGNGKGTFFVPYIIHDLSGIEIRPLEQKTGVTWEFNPESATISYSTCPNCGKISEDTHNPIEVTRNGLTCSFSNSMDTSFYNDLGLGYTSVYGSEIILTDYHVNLSSDINHVNNPSLENAGYVMIPNGLSTINPICLKIDHPKFYVETSSSPNFFPCPPDWYIRVSAKGNVHFSSNNGYLTVKGQVELKKFSCIIDSTNDWWTTWNSPKTYQNGGYFSTTVRQSSVYVEDSLPANDQVEPETDWSVIVPEDGTVYYDWINGGNSTSSCFELVGQLPGQDNNGPSPYSEYFNSSLSPSVSYLKNKGLAKVPIGTAITMSLDHTPNISTHNNPFDGSSTGHACHNSMMFKTSFFYDVDDGVVWDETGSPDGYWEELHRNNNKSMAIFMSGTYGIKNIVVTSGYTCSVQIGLCSIAENPDGETATGAVITPVVKVMSMDSTTGAKKQDYYVLVKDRTPFGVGLDHPKSTTSACLRNVLIQMTRVVVKDNYYTYNVKISSDNSLHGDIVSGMSVSPISQILLTESTGRYDSSKPYSLTAGSLDFTITHEDLIEMVYHHLLWYTTSQGGGKSEDSIKQGIEGLSKYMYYFTSESGQQCCMGDEELSIDGYSYLENIKVTAVTPS